MPPSDAGSSVAPIFSTTIVTPTPSNTPVASNTPPALVSNGGSLTLASAQSITTTDAKGQVVTTAPSSFMSTIETTSNGVVYTKTIAVYQPAGSLNGASGGSSSSFFNNHGAVAGVFVVVGLAVVAIIAALALLFFKRRRRQRLDREVTAAAVAASAAASRSPLDEEGDVHSSHPTSESYPSTMSQPMAQYNQYATTYGNAGGYDPFSLQPSSTESAVIGGAAGAAAAGGYAAYSDNPDYSQQRGYNEHGGYSEHSYNDHQYNGMEEAGSGYYYDPHSPTYDPSEGYSQQPGQPMYTPHGYEDPYGGYSGGEGSIDTPLERENPLHVTNH